MEPVVGLVADGHDVEETAGRVADQLRQFSDSPVAADLFGVADAGALPAPDHPFIDIDPRHAERTKKVALAAFIHANARGKQFRVQDGFVAQFDLLQNKRFEDKLDEVLSAFSLHHQLAALVKHHVGLFLFPGETGIRHLAERVIAGAQMRLERRRLGVGQLARIIRQWFQFHPLIVIPFPIPRQLAMRPGVSGSPLGHRHAPSTGETTIYFGKMTKLQGLRRLGWARLLPSRALIGALWRVSLKFYLD